MLSPSRHKQAVAAIDIAVRALVELRSALVDGAEDVAGALHGPARTPEYFLSAGDLAYRYNCSDETIRRTARKYSVATMQVGQRAKFDLRELDGILRKRIR